jgi:uncharacterized protein YdaU (DUF1376 family)
MRLTRDQHGGYFLLILACWDGGGRIPNDPDELAAIVKASPAEWRKLAPKLLPFFEVDGEYLVHTRVLAEHEKAARLSEIRRGAGAKGGRPKKETESNEKPIGLANGNQNGSQNETPAQVAQPSPSPLPSEGIELTLLSPIGDEPKSKYPALFEDAWQAYPHVKGRSSKPKSLAAWKRLPKAAQTALPDACRRYGRDGREPKMDGGAPAMHRWLANELFVDWLAAVANSAPDMAALPKFPNEPIRAYVAQHKGEPFTVSYLDPCTYAEGTDGRTITAPNSYTATKLKAEVPALEQRGIRIVLPPLRSAS